MAVTSALLEAIGIQIGSAPDDVLYPAPYDLVDLSLNLDIKDSGPSIRDHVKIPAIGLSWWKERKVEWFPKASAAHLRRFPGNEY